MTRGTRDNSILVTAATTNNKTCLHLPCCVRFVFADRPVGRPIPSTDTHRIRPQGYKNTRETLNGRDAFHIARKPVSEAEGRPRTPTRRVRGSLRLPR